MANPKPSKPFVKGDKRINRKGRPKDLDALRALAKEIAHTPIGVDGMTITEAILKRWAGSNDPRLQMAFIEYAYGKPPTQTEISGKDGNPITHEIIVRRGKNIPRPNRTASGTDDGAETGETV